MTKPELSTFAPVLLPVVQEYERYLPTAFDDSMTHLQKLNKVINSLAEIGKISNDVVSQWNTVMEWVMGDGLNDSSLSTLESLIENGTVGDLINNSLLSNINQAVSQRALSTDFETLKTQVTSIVANSTTTEGNTELIDSRLPTNGKTYPTVGEHIRSISKFVDVVRDRTSEYATLLPTGTQVGYIDETTKEFVAHTNYRLSYPFSCEYGDEYVITTFIFGNLVSGAVFYDESMNVLGTSGKTGNGTVDPQTLTIKIENPLCKFVAFQTGANERFKTLIRKRLSKTLPLSTQKKENGYYRYVGKTRPLSGFTDRAQIKITFDLGTDTVINPFAFGFERIENVSAVSYRLFAGVSPTTYEVDLNTYAPFVGEGVYNHLMMSRHLQMPVDASSGNQTRYVQIFVDFIATDINLVLEAIVPKFLINGREAISVNVHFGNTDDRVSDVAPYAERSPLYKKRLVGIGDSLMAGNTLGKDVTWLNQLGKKYDMDFYNYGINGNTLAYQATELTNPAMVDRYESMVDADYIVVLGGANDRRLNVPVGTNDDQVKTTFKGALNLLIDGLLVKYPKGKILFMTNYNRFPTLNGIGLSDIDYVEAMKEICKLKGIPCFDNYSDSGIDFQNTIRSEWMDEGLSTSQAKTTHLSKEAYAWVLPKYEKLIESL